MPRTDIEKELARIWSEILTIAEEDISIQDNFFELGGNSLLLTQLKSRIEQVFQIECSIVTLFQQAIIEKMASMIGEASYLERNFICKQTYPSHIPLSFAQQRLYFLNELLTQRSVYNIPAALRLQGALNVEVLEKALQSLCHRHEVLRTVIQVFDEKPEQMIRANSEFRLPLVDLSTLTQEEQEGYVKDLAKQEVHQEFDLANDILVRAKMIKLSKEEHILLITLHHIITDGWSINIIIRELNELYDAYLIRRETTLTPLVLQYADYAIWQRDYLQGEVLEKQLSFWQEEFKTLPESLALPTDKVRPKVMSYVGGTYQFKLSTETTQRLKALSQKHEVTLFMMLLAAYQVFLYRYSGQMDIVIGSPIAGRQYKETEALIGFFVNTLALRQQLSADESFVSLLARVKEKTLLAYEYQDIPFEMLIEHLHVERDFSRTPLFQVMFVLQNNEQQPLQLSGITTELLEIEHSTAKFDLTLQAQELSTDELSFDFAYASELFLPETIKRMADNFAILLTGICEDASQALAKLPMLTEKEKQTLLKDFYQTQTFYPEKTIQELFEEQVLKNPEHIAVVCEEESLSYRALNEKANLVAHYLRAQGIKADSLVAIALEKSLNLIIGILGILKAGGAYVPLDPTYPQERLQFMLEDTKASMVITTSNLAEKLTLAPQQTFLLLDTIDLTGELKSNPPLINKPNDLAYVIYTSGSTGKPKGVKCTHQGIVNRVSWQQKHYQLTEKDRWLHKTSFSFDVSVWELFWPLTCGASLTLVTDEMHLDA
jgi:non-ribosomal peptide synthetase component F/acyl carrier protein